MAREQTVFCPACGRKFTGIFARLNLDRHIEKRHPR